jgi:CHASE2 domain-containing sensor protein
MDDPQEVLLLLLAAGVVVFTVANRPRLRRLPFYRALLTAYYLLTASWTLTVLGGFFLPRLLEALGHVGYAASAVALALWCRRAFVSPEGGRT